MSATHFDFDEERFRILEAESALKPGPKDKEWECEHGEGPCGWCANYLLGDEPPSRGCCTGVGGHDAGCEGRA